MVSLPLGGCKFVYNSVMNLVCVCVFVLCVNCSCEDYHI